MTRHAAIVARELGVPCVVGTRTATTTLSDGAVVTVDGSAGQIRAGRSEPPRAMPRRRSPRPVIYRATDLRSNEFRDLAGGIGYEPDERNPMIGYRGCYRYIREPDVFGLELTALARIREQTPNLHLMIPFVRHRWPTSRARSRPGNARAGSPPSMAPGPSRTATEVTMCSRHRCSRASAAAHAAA